MGGGAVDLVFNHRVQDGRCEAKFGNTGDDLGEMMRIAGGRGPNEGCRGEVADSSLQQEMKGISQWRLFARLARRRSVKEQRPAAVES